MSSLPPLYTLPISQRPRPSLLLRAHKIAFIVSFGLSLVLIHTFQLLALPLALLAPAVYRRWISHSKEAFATLLLASTVVFAGGNEMVLTAGEGIDLDQVCRVDGAGVVQGFSFDQHSGELTETELACERC